MTPSLGLVRTAEQQHNLDYLLDAFADHVAHVVHAAAATTDGLPLAATRSVNADNREQLCASISSVMAVLEATARLMQGGGVINHMTNMDHGIAVFQKARNGLVTFMVLAEEHVDVEQLQYELERLGDRIGEILNPGLREPTTAAANSALAYRT